MKIKNFKHLNLIIVIAFCLFIFGPMGVVFAEDSPPATEVEEIVESDVPEQDELKEDSEGSFFQNPTQAQRASNLAAAYSDGDDLTENTLADIEEMRAEGIGWGEICHILEIHPSTSGMGMKHTKMHKIGWGKGLNPDGEVSEEVETEGAVALNFKTGFSKGHGMSANKGNNGGNKDNSGNSGNKGNKGKSSGNNGNKGGKIK